MTSKKQEFHNVRFSPTVLRTIEKELNQIFKREVLNWLSSSSMEVSDVDDYLLKYDEMAVTVFGADGESTEEWSYDTPAQFYPALRKDYLWSRFRISQNFWTGIPMAVRLNQWTSYVQLEVTASTPELVETIAAIFEDAAPESQREADQSELIAKPHIFVGHGGASDDWKTLLIELQNRHGLICEAFETGARAGHSIRDILSGMLDANSFALLIFSGEDEQSDGSLRSRQNVVHEAGLFQGRLGFGRAVILAEEGTELLSNLDGIQHIPFRKGDIAAVVGDVLATLRREFPSG